MYKYYSYCSDSGFELFKTEEEAKGSAQEVIDYYRGEASEGWDTEVTSVVWGTVQQETKICDIKPLTDELRDELGIDSSIDTYCDYRLEEVPNV